VLDGYTNTDIVDNGDSKKSILGYLMTFAREQFHGNGGYKIYCIIHYKRWIHAFTEGVKKLLWMKKFLLYLGIVQEKFVLHGDSQSAIHLGKHSFFHS